MATDGDDAICKSTSANLLVSGDNIDLDEFTRLFGLEPTEAGKAGDGSCWRVSSEPHVKIKNPEHHISWILDQIADKRDAIRHLKHERHCQVDIGCTWQGHPNIDGTGPFLTPDTLRRIAEFDLNLILYFVR